MASMGEEESFRRLAENNVDMICRVGADLVMRYASPACQRILGWSPEEMCGVGPDAFVLPDDLPIVGEAHDRLFIDGFDRTPTIIRMRKKDGGFAWMEVNARLVRDDKTGKPADIVLTMRDVTARKQREETLEAQLLAYSDGPGEHHWIDALRESEERFAKAFRLAPAPMAILALDQLRIRDVNDAFTAAFGHAPEAVVGGAVRNLMTGPCRAEAEQVLRKSHAVRDLEVQIARKDGDSIDCLASTETMSVDGRPCILMVLHDVTERRRSETDIAMAIEAVVRDARFSRSVVEKLEQLRQPDGAAAPAKIGDLTRRELEILGRISQGRSDEEIARVLSLSRNTVRNHLASIYSKIDVHRRSEAIVWARERGL